jgi:hypothetical protein
MDHDAIGEIRDGASDLVARVTAEVATRPGRTQGLSDVTFSTPLTAHAGIEGPADLRCHVSLQQS